MHNLIVLDDCETFSGGGFLVLISEGANRDPGDCELVAEILEGNEGKAVKRLIYRNAEATAVPGTKVIDLDHIVDYYLKHHGD